MLERSTLKVKDDEYVSPTYTRDLAAGVEVVPVPASEYPLSAERPSRGDGFG